MSKRKILYLVTEDWYFCSHRLPVARAARESGLEVLVAARPHDHVGTIRAEGFQFIPILLRRRSFSLIAEIRALFEIIRIYREHRPQIVHHIALKPVIYGSIAARLAGIPAIVNAMAGLGTLFIEGGGFRRIARFLATTAFSIALPRRASKLLLQNEDDREMLIRLGITSEKGSTVIRGSGVDIDSYHPTTPPQGPLLAILPARMLRDKGVEEFVCAARILRARGNGLRCALVGPEDPENPSAVPRRQLESWAKEGAIEWWGARADMPAVYAAAAIVCLPSYREGLPKVLLEGAASGRALIATDVPGCNGVVRNGDTGILVPVRDAAALADALEKLASDPLLRAELGARARSLVVKEFSDSHIASQTLLLYHALLSEAGFG